MTDERYRRVPDGAATAGDREPGPTTPEGGEGSRPDDPARIHLHMLASLERIDRAIRKSEDVETMMTAVLDTVLDIYECDRAWLLHPCDPDADTWTVPMERTRAGWPGAMSVGAEIPMLPEAQTVMRAALAAGRPVACDPASGRPVPPEAARAFGIRSQLTLAIHPRQGAPWLFGVHQCSHERVWTVPDRRLFEQIGRRIGDALTSLLVLRELRERERHYREVVEGTDDVVARFDPGLRATFVNQAGARVLGWPPEAVQGRPLYDALVPDDVDTTRAALMAAIERQAASVSVENRARDRDGEVHHMLWTVNLHYADGALTDLTAIGRDITERVRAEDELRSLEKRLLVSQKMEAVGTLAGGIAHDFNNVLGAIMGYADLARLNLPEDAAARPFLEQVLAASRRARDLVQQILTFSRRAEHKPAPVDVRRVVREVVRLLRASIPRTIDMHTDVPAEPAVVVGDETRLHQLLMNLCTNAYHAMRESGGRLDVSVATLRVAPDERPPAEGLTPGPYVRLTVRDTGVGMDEETLARVFEPFFTTRSGGEGTGMGLSVVHGIVKAHEGVVRLDSAPGRGTTASVYLPRHAEDAARADSAAETPAPRGAAERVLLVDDEPDLVEVGSALLRMLGYSVTATADVAEAWALFRAAPERFDVVVTDHTMPRMTGQMLADEIHAVRPELPVILCTGYSDTLSGLSAEDVGVTAILMKPVDRETLAQTLRKALGRSE